MIPAHLARFGSSALNALSASASSASSTGSGGSAKAVSQADTKTSSRAMKLLGPAIFVQNRVISREPHWDLREKVGS